MAKQVQISADTGNFIIKAGAVAAGVFITAKMLQNAGLLPDKTDKAENQNSVDRKKEQLANEKAIESNPYNPWSPLYATKVKVPGKIRVLSASSRLDIAKKFFLAGSDDNVKAIFNRIPSKLDMSLVSKMYNDTYRRDMYNELKSWANRSWFEKGVTHLFSNNLETYQDILNYVNKLPEAIPA